MRKANAFLTVITLAMIVGCGGKPSNVNVDKPNENAPEIAQQPTAEKPQPPSIDIWAAAIGGDIEAIKQHFAAGTELNEKEAAGGSTPLILASLVCLAVRRLLLVSTRLMCQTIRSGVVVSTAVPVTEIERGESASWARPAENGSDAMIKALMAIRDMVWSFQK